MNNTEYMFKSVVMGHTVADALGVPVEFCERSALDEKPVKDLTGYGTYPYPEGTWSDDTSMSLCTLDSLNKGKIDYDDIMTNFLKWLNNCEYTATGEVFDVGRACLKSIMMYSETGDIYSCGRTSDYSNGNGSLMRIHPIALFLFYKNNMTVYEKLNAVHITSALTHAHERSKIGCGIYSFVLWELLSARDKESVPKGLEKAKEYYKEYPELNHYKRIFDKNFIHTERENISSSGYIVSTLEAALWCLMTTGGYSECVLKAVNLGGDADTIGAVAGGLAGALYGYDAIPERWIGAVKRRKYIEDMCRSAAKLFETQQ